MRKYVYVNNLMCFNKLEKVRQKFLLLTMDFRKFLDQKSANANKIKACLQLEISKKKPIIK